MGPRRCTGWSSRSSWPRPSAIAAARPRTKEQIEMNRLVSRRNFLRGTGVALALPSLASLAPRGAMAQTAVRRRYLPIFLPNGAAEAWKPANAGQGAAWQLSGVLEPLGALKAQMTVITGLENGTAFNENGSASVEPSHGRQPGAWLTCIDPGIVRTQLGVAEANRISLRS